MRLFCLAKDLFEVLSICTLRIRLLPIQTMRVVAALLHAYRRTQSNIIQGINLKKCTFGKSPAFRRVINFKSTSLSPAYSWLWWRKTTIKPLSLCCSKRKNDSRHSYQFENKAIIEMFSARCRILQESLEMNSLHDPKNNRCLSVSGQSVIHQWLSNMSFFFSIYTFYFYS